MRVKSATPRVPVTVLLPIGVAEQLRRAQAKYDDSAPKAIARALDALEEKSAEPTAA
jgi:hypothetical protein